MAFPPPASSGGSTPGSLETEPTGAPEREPALSPEQQEARRAEALQASTAGRTDISLERLQERTRSYDKETPDLINRINLSESLETQRPRLEALKTVATNMVAVALAKNPDLAKQFDISTFENIPLFGEAFAGISDPSENAAFHKLRELRERVEDSEIARHMKEEWPEVVTAAQKIAPRIRNLLQADLRTKSEGTWEKTKAKASEAVELYKAHPIIGTAVLAAGAYGVYKVFSWLFGGKKEKTATAEPGKEGEKKEPEKKGGFLKWVVGIGLGVAGIFGLGRMLGAEGFQKFVKDKIGWDLSSNRVAQALTAISHGEFKKAWEVMWEGADENADFHVKMADIIGKDQKTEVSARTLFELKDEKFENFISWKSQAADMAGIQAAEIPYLGKAAQYLFDSRKENEEQIAVRGFLQKHEKTVRTLMAVRDNTTLEQVFQKLYEHLTGQKPDVKNAAPAVAAAAVAGAATPNPEQQQRDGAINRLPKAKKQRAIENEQVLREKITTAEIARMQRDIDDKETALRDLLAKPLKPTERQKAEDKLKTLLEQKGLMGKLTDKHSEAAAAYLNALESDVSEEVVIERFANLVESKEAIEDIYNEIFQREGWTELQALAATHAIRFTTTAYRRWLKAEDIRIDHANYLFDRFKSRLNPKNLINRFRSRTGPAMTLADVRTRTDQMFDDIDESIKRWNTEASGMKKEWMQRKHFEALDKFEAEAAEQHKTLGRLWTEKTRELKAAAKAGDTPRVKGLQAELNEIAGHKVKIEFGQMKNFGGCFKRWQEAFKGNPQDPVYEQGINKLRMYFREALRTSKKLQAASDAQHSLSKVILRRGRLVFLAGGLVLGGETLADEKTSRTKAYTQAGLSMLPLTGTYLDFYSAIAAEEQITGRKLDVTDRALAGLFGTVGLACDALSVFGIGLVGRAALTAVKAGRGMSAAVRAARAAGKIEKAADAGKALKTIETLQKARKWGFRVSLATALGVPAYMAFTETAELPVSADFQREVIGNAGIETAPENPTD